MDVLVDILWGFWQSLGQMAPYLLFGFLVAGLLSVFLSAETVERHLGGRGISAVLKASAFGVPLPLCSCGVIPVGASLRRHGASRGATTAFLISTPQTGVDSILATLSLLGPVYAVFRPVVALLSGTLGGLLATAVEADGPGSDGRGADADGGPCTDSCCADGPRRGRLVRALVYGFDTMPRDIGRSLLVGLILAALITALVPKNTFEPVLGGGVGAMLLMMLVGIPVYVCATASVPLAAAMIDAGVSPGAALVFLMTGPATNAATIATIWKVMGRRTAVVYLATVAVCALAGGLTLDYLFAVSGSAVAPPSEQMIPPAVRSAAAVVLLGVLVTAVVRSYLPAGRPGGGGQVPEGVEAMRTELRITGMTCEHCRRAVERALRECDGAEAVEVDLAGGRAVVTGAADAEALCAAVAALGYEAEAVATS